MCVAPLVVLDVLSHTPHIDLYASPKSACASADGAVADSPASDRRRMLAQSGVGFMCCKLRAACCSGPECRSYARTPLTSAPFALRPLRAVGAGWGAHKKVTPFTRLARPVTLYHY